ncbi:GlsB/YeaQ/YmgE family stress response membrane protein [Phaeobacter gallaeciensis]|uniref:GlsB/YeaQ/YmgE family stress response membrane protein n=2 Tax=Roseobacteraceae TaxID=2854170 RepID=A0A366WUH3_9RHOB|nr:MULTISPECIES: GlsB/YeaQ/YmgE family stress response membrane protein [Roseobacteraceae]MBT3143867.1 GlsB/YeaQ/YmgE family stress response membrane protein [Falsiruegeria litorea]RBW52431.1 GlsB/YeaQ/YmgE family stress response membrane protein [Phaeobacter gallaeciensis]
MDGLSWVMVIVIGGVAGLIASRIMKRNHSLTGNVILGILGAVSMNVVLKSALGLQFGGIVGQFIVAVIGASAIIALFQALRKNRA